MEHDKFLTYHPEIPLPSDEVIQSVFDLINTSNTTYRFSKNSKSSYRNFNTYNVDGIIKDWIDRHIGPLFEQESYYAIVQTINDSLAVHVDTTRTYAYNFLLECGGEDVHTIWTEQADDESPITYDAVIPKATWHRLNTSEPHGVRNIKSKRIAISVGNVTKINKEAVRQQRNFEKNFSKTKI